MKRFSIQYLTYLYVVFFFLMLIDAHITNFFTNFNHNTSIWQSELLLLVMLFAAGYLPQRYMILSALTIGVLFDLYFLGLIGVYAVALPVAVWLMYVFHSIYYQNLMTLFFSWIVSLTVVQLVTLGIQLMFKITTIKGEFFVTNSFAPTLVLNIIYFAILMFPLKKFFKLDIPIV